MPFSSYFVLSSKVRIIFFPTCLFFTFVSLTGNLRVGLGPLTRLYRSVTRRWRSLESIDEVYCLSETFWEYIIRVCISILVLVSDYVRIAWYTFVEFTRNVFVGLASIITVAVVEDGDRTGYERIIISIERPKASGKRGTNMMPELEDLSANKSLQTNANVQNQNGPLWSTGLNIFVELEPAFIEEKDFPVGWMVYHSSLGVVAKSVADKHDQANISKIEEGYFLDRCTENRDNETKSVVSIKSKIIQKESFIRTQQVTQAIRSSAVSKLPITDHQDETSQLEQPSPIMPILRSIVAN